VTVKEVITYAESLLARDHDHCERCGEPGTFDLCGSCVVEIERMIRRHAHLCDDWLIDER
jgi:hypothetical protein